MMCLNKVLVLDLKKNKSAEVWPRGMVRLVNSCLGYLVAYPKMRHTDIRPTSSLTTSPCYSRACIRISRIHLPLFWALLTREATLCCAQTGCMRTPARPQSYVSLFRVQHRHPPLPEKPAPITPVPSAARSTARSPSSASLLTASPCRVGRRGGGREGRRRPAGCPSRWAAPGGRGCAARPPRLYIAAVPGAARQGRTKWRPPTRRARGRPSCRSCWSGTPTWPPSSRTSSAGMLCFTTA